MQNRIAKAKNLMATQLTAHTHSHTHTHTLHTALKLKRRCKLAHKPI